MKTVKTTTKKEDHYKRRRRTLHNDQGTNERGRYNNCKYIRNQNRRTSIYKASANTIKRDTGSRHWQWGTLTPHLHEWTDHPDRKSIKNHRH